MWRCRSNRRECEWPTCSVRLTLRGRTADVLGMRLRAGFDRLEKKEVSCRCQESNHDSTVVQPSLYQLSYPDPRSWCWKVTWHLPQCATGRHKRACTKTDEIFLKFVFRPKKKYNFHSYISCTSNVISGISATSHNTFTVARIAQSA